MIRFYPGESVGAKSRGNADGKFVIVKGGDCLNASSLKSYTIVMAKLVIVFLTMNLRIATPQILFCLTFSKFFWKRRESFAVGNASSFS